MNECVCGALMYGCMCVYVNVYVLIGEGGWIFFGPAAYYRQVRQVGKGRQAGKVRQPRQAGQWAGRGKRQVGHGQRSQSGVPLVSHRINFYGPLPSMFINVHVATCTPYSVASILPFNVWQVLGSLGSITVQVTVYDSLRLVVGWYKVVLYLANPHIAVVWFQCLQ